MVGMAINPLAMLGGSPGDGQQAPGFMSGSKVPPPPPAMAGSPADTIDVSKGLPLEVLAASIKLRLEGSRRMMTRERQMQMAQFLGQVVFNGQFLAQINQQGKTVDYVEFARMLDDAMGIEHTYIWMRDLKPEEQAKLQQPPPQVLAAQQKTQSDAQTRLQIMQMKQQGEKYHTDAQVQIAQNKADEESAQEILKLLAKEKADLLARQPDPAKQQAAVLDMMGKVQDLKHASDLHQLGMTQQSQQGQMDMQQQGQQGGVDLLKQISDAQMGLANAKQQHQQEMNHMREKHAVGLAQSMDKHNAQMQQMKDRAAASRVLGGPEGKDRGAPG